jgi:predicted nucleic acid-binding protein
MSRVLVDAGPLVAILHADDQDHARCTRALDGIRGRLETTWAPFTEAMYRLSFSRPAQDSLLALVERGAVHILETTADDVPPIRALMMRYESLPMDFADATLVHAADREGIRTVFTLDRRDFTTYRIGRRGVSFKILP